MKLAAGRKYNIGKQKLFGEEGEQIQFIVDEPAERTLIDGVVSVLSDNAMNHWHESERHYRSVDSPNWHGVTDAVVTATTVIQEITSNEDIRREFIWDRSLAFFQEMASSSWKNGDKVVVSAANAASDCHFISDHPSKIAVGATKGILFCSTLLGMSRDEEEEVNINEAWDIVQVPLKAGEGRLLATLRMLPLVVGWQTDLAIVIVDGGYSKHAAINLIFQEMPSLGISYGSYKRGWNPVSAGQFWSIGRAFENHYEELRCAFCKFGHVYGTDEAWLLSHNPIAVVSQSVHLYERRAFCWKPSTVVKNVRWIIWDDQHEKNGESYLRPVTKVQDLLEMEAKLRANAKRSPTS